MKTFRQILSFILIISMFQSTNFIYAYSSSKFSSIGNEYSIKSTDVKGNYRFDLNYNKMTTNYDLNIYKKNSSKSFVYLSDISSNVLANSRTLYFSKNNVKDKTIDLMYMNIPTKKVKHYTSFKNAQNLYFEGLSGGNVYFSLEKVPTDENNPQSSLYVLNPYSGKIKTVLNDAKMSKLGRSRILFTTSQNEKNAYTLYSCDYFVKNSKKISDNVVYHEAINGKLYYVSFENPRSGCELYVSNEDGRNKRLLSKKFKCQNILSITPSQITYVKHNYSGDKVSFHQMDISSGNTKEIPNPMI